MYKRKIIYIILKIKIEQLVINNTTLKFYLNF